MRFKHWKVSLIGQVLTAVVLTAATFVTVVATNDSWICDVDCPSCPPGTEAKIERGCGPQGTTITVKAVGATSSRVVNGDEGVPLYGQPPQGSGCDFKVTPVMGKDWTDVADCDDIDIDCL